MAEGSGSDQNIRQRLESLEQMDKLLLRAQVLQQVALEHNARAVEQNQKAIERHDAWVEEHRLIAKEAAERQSAPDERIDKLVSFIGELISRIPPSVLQR